MTPLDLAIETLKKAAITLERQQRFLELLEAQLAKVEAERDLLASTLHWATHGSPQGGN